MHFYAGIMMVVFSPSNGHDASLFKVRSVVIMRIFQRSYAVWHTAKQAKNLCVQKNFRVDNTKQMGFLAKNSVFITANQLDNNENIYQKVALSYMCHINFL
jgi:hypothetical protein